MAKLLLLNGPPGSGKDLATELLLDHTAIKTVGYKMARPLKMGSYDLLGYDCTNGDQQFHNLVESTKSLMLDRPVNVKYTSQQPVLNRLLCQRLGKTYAQEFETVLITHREFLIFISEDIIKPMFGDDFFGQAAVKYMKTVWNIGQAHGIEKPDLIVVSDSGFVDESLPLIELFGKDYIKLIQVYRPGFSYSGDSRSYINLEDHGVETIEIHNDSSIQNYQNKLNGLIQSLI